MGAIERITHPNFFELLPDEIIVGKIFPNLSAKDLVCVGFANRRLNNLSKDESLWHVLATDSRIYRPLATQHHVTWYKLYSARQRKLNNVFEESCLGNREKVFSMASIQGQLLTGTEGKIRLWDVASKKNVCVFEGHKRNVHVLAVDTNSQLIASASPDKTVLIWAKTNEQNKKWYGKRQVSQGERRVTLNCFSHTVTSLVFKNGMLYLALPGQVQAWDVETKKCIKTFIAPRSNQSSIFQLDVDHQHLVFASEDRQVHIWDLRQESLLDLNFEPNSDFPNEVHSVMLSGPYLFSGLQRSNLTMRDLRNHKVVTNDRPVAKNNQRKVMGALNSLKTDQYFIYCKESLAGRVSLWHPRTGEFISDILPWGHNRQANPLSMEIINGNVFLAAPKGGVISRNYTF